MSFFKKDELRLLWPFYLEALVFRILCIFPIFFILYFRDLGFTLFNIGIITSMWSLPGLLFEIPTGAIADLFGRKFSTLLGKFLVSITLFSIFFFKDFKMILILFFLLGIFETFISGANESWIVDMLRYNKRKNLVDVYFAKRQSFGGFSAVLTGFIGAFFVKHFGLSIIWPISGISLFLSSCFLLLGNEHFIRKKQKVKEHIKDFVSHTKKSISYSINHHAISIILIISMFMGVVIAFTGDITWYPFLQSLGLQEHWFGYLFSATFVLTIFTPYFIKPLVKKVGTNKNFLAIVTSVMAIFVIIVFFVNSLIGGILVFFLFISMWDFFHPANRSLFHMFVPGKMRATISSFDNMLFSTLITIAFPIVGLIADRIGPQNTIPLAALVLIPVAILYSRINEKPIK
jgi:MFS family permease